MKTYKQREAEEDAKFEKWKNTVKTVLAESTCEQIEKINQLLTTVYNEGCVQGERDMAEMIHQEEK